MQFGQVGVGDTDDHCFPVQVKFPEDQVWHISGGINELLKHTSHNHNIYAQSRT